jgi:hypothetical protein
VGGPKSERLCPCGDRLPEWLTADYVVSTLSKEGAWPSLPASLTGPAPLSASRVPCTGWRRGEVM